MHRVVDLGLRGLGFRVEGFGKKTRFSWPFPRQGPMIYLDLRQLSLPSASTKHSSVGFHFLLFIGGQVRRPIESEDFAT